MQIRDAQIDYTRLPTVTIEIRYTNGVRYVGEPFSVTIGALIDHLAEGIEWTKVADDNPDVADDPNELSPTARRRQRPVPRPRPRARTTPPGGTPARGNAAWRLRAWDDQAIQQAMIAGSFVAISADEIGDVSSLPNDDELCSRLEGAFPDRLEAVPIFVSYWRSFLHEIATGDVVAVPLVGHRVAIGLVVGDYHYVGDEPEPRLRHRHSVRWVTTDLERSDLRSDLMRTVNAPGTLVRFRGLGARDALLRQFPHDEG